ncbi:MAG: ATP-binding protein [Mariprofundus sp.]|nr:ATP-binding protein [Mariprofundus sp.]
MRLIFYRALAALVIAVVVTLWIYPTLLPMQKQLMMVSGGLFLILLLLQSALVINEVPGKRQWIFQHASDIVLSSLLIFSSGGLLSPFYFLFGLIIIASGTYALQAMPLAMSALACSGYLAAVYGDIWLIHHLDVNTQQALHLLLQVSALMLVGGVMAYIARHQASLRASSDKIFRQHRRLKDIHDNIMAEMREGVIVLDSTLHVSDMNESATTLLGKQSVDALLAIPALDAFFCKPLLPEVQCEYDHHGRTLLLTVRKLTPDVDAAWLLTLVDISEIRHLEKQLIQQEKMALLGKMSATLAHEIRNPIHTMAQGLEIMARTSESNVDIQGILRDEMMRLNRLANMLLEYSRPLHPAPVQTYMPEVIKSSLNQLDITGCRKVNWQCFVDELLIDSDHFRLVMDNLLSNALAYRYPDSDVTVCLDADEISWMLRVDNEGDIPEVIREKLFEPFISSSSNGIGLGLATVQQVCIANDWTVESGFKDGKVCFTIRGLLQPEMVNMPEHGQNDMSREVANG